VAAQNAEDAESTGFPATTLMPLYVFALIDAAPAGASGRGLGSSLTFRRVAGAFAAVERRADVPPVEMGLLAAHQRIVERLADRVSAILPVRFGTLLTIEELEEALAERDEELADALDFVRGRRQMTWRVRRPTTGDRGPKTEGQGPKIEGRGPKAEGGPAKSPGTQYLLRAREAATTTASPAFRSVRERIGPFAAAERYQRPTDALPESFYHLVDSTHMDHYKRTARELLESTSSLTMSGPWAPYAFVPDLF
jgi:hypothetical protein